MTTTRSRLGLAAAALVALGLTAARPTDVDTRGLRMGSAPVQSLGALTFGPDGTLFAADVRASTLYAFDPGESGAPARFGKGVMSADVDAKVAALLGTTRDRVRFNDMAVHPTSHTIYLSVTRLDGEQAQPALIRVRGPDSVEVVDLSHVEFASAPIPEAPSREATTPWGQPQWTLTVTHLGFVDGELYVAGLSNEQFASALRRVPFPFAKGGSLNTVEIFHTSHGRWETAAPIEAFAPITVRGERLIIAGYGCSPLALFRRADLDARHHLRGRTVAELGGGNRPIDIVVYRKDGKDWLLIANNNRTLMRMDPAELATAPAMTTPVTQTFQPGGVPYLPVASAGVLQLDDFDARSAVVLQRDLQNGAVNLVALSKQWL